MSESADAEMRSWLDRLTAAPEDSALADEAGRAVTAMGWRAQHGLELLVTTLRDADADPDRRLAAVRLLGFVRSEVAVEPLVQALLDEQDAVMRWEAGAGLRRLADLAVPVLAEGLKHYSQDIRKVAVFALGVIGPAAAAAIPELTKLQSDPRPKLRARVEAGLREIRGEGTPV